MRISAVDALEVLDSRGKPTVRAVVKCDDGSVHTATVPSGASTGSHEAVELRDNNPSRYLGFGVQNAVQHVKKEISDLLVGKLLDEPQKLDILMKNLDGTPNKSRLGANAVLAVSLAIHRAGAQTNHIPLWNYLHSLYFSSVQPSFPRLMVNVVNGGKHAGWNFDIQEFMISPTATEPSQSVRVASEIFLQLGLHLKKRNLSTLVGDEGGYSPLLSSNEEVLEAIHLAGQDREYHLQKEYDFCVDAAATEFFKEGSYFFKKTNQKFSGKELADYYHTLGKTYNILSFEDPFAEDDWESFTHFTAMEKNEHKIIVGDDLYVTDPKRIAKGVQMQATNAVLIKPNQIGTVSETAEAINQTRKAGWSIVISHRSGETEDSFIADLAFGCAAHFIKTGSMSRSERLAKYNRLLEIEKGI